MWGVSPWGRPFDLSWGSRGPVAGHALASAPANDKSLRPLAGAQASGGPVSPRLASVGLHGRCGRLSRLGPRRFHPEVPGPTRARRKGGEGIQGTGGAAEELGRDQGPAQTSAHDGDPLGAPTEGSRGLTFGIHASLFRCRPARGLEGRCEECVRRPTGRPRRSAPAVASRRAARPRSGGVPRIAPVWSRPGRGGLAVPSSSLMTAPAGWTWRRVAQNPSADRLPRHLQLVGPRDSPARRRRLALGVLGVVERERARDGRGPPRRGRGRC